MSEHVSASLGAYVLGALEPAERAQVEAHLPFCTACRDQLAAIAGLPGLLSQLRPEDLDVPDVADVPDVPADGSQDSTLTGPGADVLRRALTELAGWQRRKRIRTRVVGAAASVVVLTAGAGIATSLSTPNAPHPASFTTVAATDRGSHAAALFELHPQPWGTAVTVRLQHVPAGTHCRLTTIDHRGQQQTISSWQADYDGGASITGASDLAPTDIATLQIITANGHTIISAATA